MEEGASYETKTFDFKADEDLIGFYGTHTTFSISSLGFIVRDNKCVKDKAGSAADTTTTTTGTDTTITGTTTTGTGTITGTPTNSTTTDPLDPDFSTTVDHASDAAGHASDVVGHATDAAGSVNGLVDSATDAVSSATDAVNTAKDELDKNLATMESWFGDLLSSSDSALGNVAGLATVFASAIALISF